MPAPKAELQGCVPRARAQVRRTRGEMHKKINADYYGFRDEEDGVLEKLEAGAELAMRQQVRELPLRPAPAQLPSRQPRPGREPLPAHAPSKPNQAIEEWTERENKRQATEASRNTDDADGPPDSAAQQFVAYVPLPDQKAIEQRVLESKKQQLLSKYASEGLQREQADAKVLLNRKG